MGERGSSPTNRGPRAGSPRGVVAREGSDRAYWEPFLTVGLLPLFGSL